MDKHREMSFREFIKQGQFMPCLKPAVHTSQPHCPAPACHGDEEGRNRPNCGHSCESTGHWLSVEILAEREHDPETIGQAGCVLFLPGC